MGPRRDVPVFSIYYFTAGTAEGREILQRLLYNIAVVRRGAISGKNDERTSQAYSRDDNNLTY